MPNTQGMTTNESGLSFTGTRPEVPFKPVVRTVFTPEERKELKQMMREVLEDFGFQAIYHG